MGRPDSNAAFYHSQLVILWMRITKVTTKTGDAGETGLGSGKRVQKNHPRIMVLGELDHLNSIIGWAISACGNKELAKPLKNIQQDIFNIGADMSLPERDADLLKKERLTDLEHQIDSITNVLPPLKEFILPGGNELISRIHIARTTCRNTERAMISMFNSEGVNELHGKYINRLSDYLFSLARLVKHNEGVEEEHWAFEK
jgi:cob(I)alamin adenosyltransferase